MAFEDWNLELLIKRAADELGIAMARRRMADVLGNLAKFSPDFMATGRSESAVSESGLDPMETSAQTP